jgi:hypothetical protein
MSEETYDAALNALEGALAALHPHPGRLDRDRLLFRAGQASVRRGWQWPTATAVLTAVAASLAGLMLLRPPSVVERVVYVSQPPEPKGSAPEGLPRPSETTAPREYGPLAAAVRDRPPSRLGNLRLRDLALERGVEALPDLPSTPFVAHPLTVEDLSDVPPGTLHYPSSLLQDATRQPGGPL